MTKDNKETVFVKCKKIALELEKKGNLSYASWADVWDVFKSEFWERWYKIWHENEGWTLWLFDSLWWYAKVTVGIEDYDEITTYLPIMDHQNQSMKDKPYKTKYEKTVPAYDSMAVNKTYQRATVKAIAELTWIGLYVYKGEDLPSEEQVVVAKEDKKTTAPTATPAKKADKPKDHIMEFEKTIKSSEKKDYNTLVWIAKEHKEKHWVSDGSEDYKKMQTILVNNVMKNG